MALIGKHLDVVTDCGGNDAENATAYKEDGEPKEPRLVEGEKHGYRLSGEEARRDAHMSILELKFRGFVVPSESIVAVRV